MTYGVHSLIGVEIASGKETSDLFFGSEPGSMGESVSSAGGGEVQVDHGDGRRFPPDFQAGPEEYSIAGLLQVNVTYTQCTSRLHLKILFFHVTFTKKMFHAHVTFSLWSSRHGSVRTCRSSDHDSSRPNEQNEGAESRQTDEGWIDGIIGEQALRLALRDSHRFVIPSLLCLLYFGVRDNNQLTIKHLLFFN